ncbi:hypothetical protein WICMUC_003741 [Wickerhamomyces mucosus]|uniref:Programmed cell death protein 2 C-terminal domain-containing protein n=1 Tax=Wickerhamomyces mucosus TaxID=1378264 RepID=A0A9P8PK37_9ASCO|nr:hypothetical protein WICMUC_003741 [Wickerhamomyces mucosus]
MYSGEVERDIFNIVTKMSGYSSDEEESEIPKTSSVYLGYVDVDFESAEEEPTIEDSFIGGQPVWLHPESKPAADLITCKNCNKPLALVLQAFSPLDGTSYDRVIYVFSCKDDLCKRKPGSVRVIRGVSKDPKRIEEAEQQQQAELKDQLDAKLKLDNARDFLFDNNKQESNPFGASSDSNPFGGASDSNPFGSNSSGFNSLSDNPFGKKPEEPKKENFSSFASVAAKAAPPKVTPKKSTFKELPEYPGYFLYVDQEKFHKKPVVKDIKVDDSVLDFEAETSPSGGSNLSPESQAISNSLQDSVFQHFSEIVSYNPLQVLRYDLGGIPLLFSSSDEVAKKISKDLIPKPGYNLSSSRKFELQIMPKIIMDFEQDVSITSGIDWATIIVYTDVEDYIPELDENHVGYVEEWVGVQWEESLKRK